MQELSKNIHHQQIFFTRIQIQQTFLLSFRIVVFAFLEENFFYLTYFTKFSLQSSSANLLLKCIFVSVTGVNGHQTQFYLLSVSNVSRHTHARTNSYLESKLSHCLHLAELLDPFWKTFNRSSMCIQQIQQIV